MDVRERTITQVEGTQRKVVILNEKPQTRCLEACKDMPEGLIEPELSDIALAVLERRYLIRDNDGNVIETPKQMFWRVARYVAEADSIYGADEDQVNETAWDFYDMMAKGLFMPNSPTLMNAARPLGQLAACFVLPVEDSLKNGESGIYDTLTNMALIHQSGGGTGFDFSHLRPQGARVKSTTGVASGPVSFMKLYDASTQAVKQGGTRRGANMGILRCDHPDIMEFITCKADTSEITNFNISVAITDEFMRALKEDSSIPARLDGVPTGARINPGAVWDAVIDQAHATGEPGLFFVDEANRYNPLPNIAKYSATNPCGEQNLFPNDVCNLGSINLGKFVVPSRQIIGGGVEYSIDFKHLTRVIHTAVRFLDNVVDMNTYPLPQIEDLAKRIRRIGLGVMGWADMLVKLGLTYGDSNSLEMADKLAKHLKVESRVASRELARDRGPFPEWKKSQWGDGAWQPIAQMGDKNFEHLKLRNCNLTTVAPTGTISIIAGCSGGIEPLYALAFERNQAGMRMLDVNQDLTRALEGVRDGGRPYNIGLVADALLRGKQLKDLLSSQQQGLAGVFVTAHDVTPKQHVRMQAAWQKHIDSSISKTINLPHDATATTVNNIYELAHRLKCKGITVYRDGSRPEQVLSTKKAGVSAEAPEAEETVDERYPGWDDPTPHPLPETWSQDRPQILQGSTVKVESPLGSLYVTINEYGGRPLEVFCTVAKAGGSASASAEALGRLASLALRNAVPLAEVRNQLRGIACDKPVGFGPNKVLSVPDGVAKALAVYLDSVDDAVETVAPTTERAAAKAHEAFRSAEPCGECGSSNVAYESGCSTCYTCGNSACG